ncbi:ORF57 [black bullhead herpesvirus]|uniref:DNA polymerase n=2 Tax=black bullhead herpesvirus TaxID=508441 RepID=D5FM46_9VIRU|nr:ORF57 [black bullhead herpesvirus]ACZ55873.2 ORF57 [black bullhead herpesvirus]
MDRNAVLCEVLKHRLPQWTEIPDDSPMDPYFFSSVRYISIKNEDGILIQALNLRTNEVVTFLVMDINFLALVPMTHINNPQIQMLVSTAPLAYRAPIMVFNGDLKKEMYCELLVFKTMGDQKAFIEQGNNVLKPLWDNIYTYGDHVSNYDGNTVVLQNNLMCSHVYYTTYKTTPYTPQEFFYDEARDQKFLMNLRDIIPRCKHEAAFDIETIVHETAMDPDLRCKAFADYEFRDLEYCRLAVHELQEAGVKGLPPSPFVGITQKMHEITSISLVVCNYHKTGEQKKDYFIYYNNKLVKNPLEMIPVEHLQLDPARLKISGCKNEFYMLLAFINQLRKSVNVLYVYNANFDIQVILQRLRYYAFRGRTGLCCAAHREIPLGWGETLMAKWEGFISAKPELFKGQILMSQDILKSNYIKLLKGLGKLLATPSDPETRLGLIKARILAYRKMKDTVQNFKSHGFACDIIDMMYVCKRKEFEAKDGSLNTVAKLIIEKFKPGKAKIKTHKLDDVTYDKLDEYYREGGTKLAQCLIYNLIDSLLVVRIAKCLRPMEEYIYRQLACYNIDTAAHTRGVMNFCGFIQSTKVVEVSRNKARLDSGIVVATDMLHNSLFEPETVARRGGFVMAPLTGLFFAQPTQCLELCLDFASMYPSMMCDLNISPETIIGHDKTKYANDYMGYDWSKIDQGFNKYTLVLRVDRTDPDNPVLKRHISDTSVSLKRYLRLRTEHKRALKKSTGHAAEYHNRLQNEMKICTNTHYGVSEHTCSLMITTQGQHKIKHVNRFIKTLNRNGHNLFPNYGDTDSTMLYHPSDINETQLSDMLVLKEDVREELKEYMLKKLSQELIDRVVAKAKGTDTFVQSFLSDVEMVLFDDMVEKLRLFHGAEIIAPVKRDGTWWVTDPMTGVEMDCSTPFRSELICKLEYENASSIGCHVAKKMYLCLVHELNEGMIVTTKIKKRGMTGFKSSRFGATENITDDFMDLIFKGGALVKTGHLESLKPVTWDKLSAPVDILHLSEPPIYENGHCTNMSSINLIPYRVTAIRREPVEGIKGGEIVYVDLQESSSGTRYVHVVILGNGCALNHFFSAANVLHRELSFEAIAMFRAFFVGAGFLDLNNIVMYERATKLKTEFLSKITNYDLYVGKKLKIPFVTLHKRKTDIQEITGSQKRKLDYPSEWARQDPTMALFRRYPVDLRIERMMMDYFGAGLKCTGAAFTPPAFRVSGEMSRHSIVIKNHIDKHYLNDNSKFLAHVVMDRAMPISCYVTADDDIVTKIEGLVSTVVRTIQDTQTKLKLLSEQGGKIFHSFFRQLPPEMNNLDISYKYNPSTDLALKPISRLPPLAHGDPETIYQDMVEIIGGLIQKIPHLVEFVDWELEKSSNKTLTLLTPKLARDLGVKPLINSLSDDTGNPNLIKLAHGVYIATLMLHYIQGDQLELNDLPRTTRTGVIGEPPKQATKKQLLTWFNDLGELIAQKEPMTHCAGCAEFWMTHGADPNFIKNVYRVAGGVFVRKIKKICL